MGILFIVNFARRFEVTFELDFIIVVIKMVIKLVIISILHNLKPIFSYLLQQVTIFFDMPFVCLNKMCRVLDIFQIKLYHHH